MHNKTVIFSIVALSLCASLWSEEAAGTQDNGKLASLEIQVKDLQRKIMQPPKLAALEGIEKELIDLRNQLAQAKEEKEKLTAQLQTALQEMKEKADPAFFEKQLTAQSEEAKTVIAGLQEVIEKQRGRTSGLEVELTSLHDKLAGLEQESREFAKVKEHAETLKVEFAASIGQQEKLQSELTHIKNSVALLDDVKSKMGLLEHNIQKVHSQIVYGDERTSGTRSMEAQMKGVSAQMNDMKKKMDQMPMMQKPPHGESNLSFSGDWLFWKVEEGGRDYQDKVLTEDQEELTYTVDKVRGDQLEYQWQSGYRLNLMYICNEELWDVAVRYTHFSPAQSASSEGKITPNFIFNEFPAALFSTASFAKTALNFQTLDIEIGKSYYTSKNFFMRPFAGVKGAKIAQHDQYIYDSLIEDDAFPSLGNQGVVQMKNDSKAIGLLAGVVSHWQLGLGFDLSGKIASSLLYSHFDVSNFQTVDGDTFFSITTDLHRIIPEMDLMFGLSWSSACYKDKVRFGLGVNYEMQLFFDQNLATRLTSVVETLHSPTNDNLGLHGLTFDVRFDF